MAPDSLIEQVQQLRSEVAEVRSEVAALRKEIAPLIQFRLGAKGIWWFISAVCMIGVAVAGFLALIRK